MKKLTIVCIVWCLSLSAFGQGTEAKKGHDLKPEEMANLHTKKLTLALDLSDAQSKQVYDLVLQQANKSDEMRKTRAQHKTEGKRPSKEERIALYNKRLDEQIAHQRAMKNILSEEQFTYWRKQHTKRKMRKEGNRSNRSRGRGRHRG